MSTSPERTTTHQRPDPYMAIWVLLCASVSMALAPWLHPRWAADPLPTTPDCIDANTAPWWELTAMPRIGMATAFEIVRYRDQATSERGANAGPLRRAAMSRVGERIGEATNPRRGPAFTSVADLAQVRGIGPVTLQRIGPHLCLPPSASGKQATGLP